MVCPRARIASSLMFAEDASTGVVQLKDHGTGQVFATADALSEFLLVPVFTGRPR